ncbi:MAG: DNA repair protein RecN [Planctomycetota bacterium]|nr:DNA repair protein RecN [Planctomycetota bacterium]
MLEELSIRNLALIERAELRFGSGLNAITGETGAGKTLLVEALELLLGRTPRGGAASIVRAGADEARVEGRVIVPGGIAFERVHAWLASELPEIADAFHASREDGAAELVLGRTVTCEGRTRAHVNHRPVTRRALRGLSALLIEIHGQNDHQLLFDPTEQLRLLDGYGELGGLLDDYAERRAAWLALLERASRLEEQRDGRRDRLELLRFQRGELKEARLQAGEHADLREERGLLRNAGELGADLDGLVASLSESDDSLSGRLQHAERTLARWLERVSALRAPAADLREALIHLEEAAAALASFRSGVEVDPARLEAVEERLAELERLEHKYAARVDGDDGLLARIGGIEAEIRALEAEEDGLESLGAELASARSALDEAAARLSEARRELAPKLSRAVVATLFALGLANARFEVQLAPRGGDAAEDAARFGPRGADECELLLSANPGEPLMPLRRVASGGEAARIMLALRTVLREGALGHTLVFDEIDAGVGGRLGPEVGAHLRALAEEAQVLCVTHLPAIAALAHVHLRATKEVRGGRTSTTVVSLTGDDRIGEVAAMIAGGANEETALAEARRLCAMAT